jgi:two-component system, cell cycle sensor histidine kinase and response regulator CckA
MNINQLDQNYLSTLVVLYVEDDPDTHAQFSEFLQHSVGTLITAANGAEGLAAFIKHSPDIVITDILMPVMDGLFMTVGIREVNPSVPVLVTTAFEQSDYLMRAINIGVDQYVTKPVNSSLLLECLLKTAHRLRAEEQLNLQQQQELQSISTEHQKLHGVLHTVFELSPVGIILVDGQGLISFANRCMADMFSCRSEDLVNTNYLDLFHSDDLWGSMERIQGLLTGKVRNISDERKFVRKDGGFLWGDLTISCLKNEIDSQKSMLAIISDVSDRKHTEKKRLELEQQLFHAQKMELVGVLAGGIAHDFNNILTIINGYADLLQIKRRNNEENIIFANEISAAVYRAADITRSLLAFSGKKEIVLQYQGLNQILTSIGKSLSRLICENIIFTIHPGSEPLLVYVDRVQIDQVLINLVVNARDAIGADGTITVSTVPVEFAATRQEGGTVIPPGRYACMIVADSGSGVDGATLSHIFEPFFTTKEKGQGTGLGLAIVKSIVIKHNGFISVTSTIGIGTEFRVYLPRHIGKVPKKSVEKRPTLKHHGTEMLLMVEDDNSILKIYKEVLGRYGYRVLTACDGAEAMEVYAANCNEIQIVVVDAIMPRMNGFDVVKLIRESRPELPVIMTSGYSNEIFDCAANNEPKVLFLQKPTKLYDLLTAIRSVLNPNGHSQN